VDFETRETALRTVLERSSPKPVFFASPDALRTWFEKHHDRIQEQWIGFYKKDSRKPSITWPEAVDVALCFGWIDGSSEEFGCFELHHPLHATETAKRLERHKHKARP
jgi:hypothetical protein